MCASPHPFFLSFFLSVLVVNEEEGMLYGCCNKKVGWFPSYYVKTE